MRSHQRTAFQRAFPTRALFQGRARRAVLWSALASLTLVLLLLDLYLLADLLTHQGQVELPGKQLPRLEELTGSHSLLQADPAARRVEPGLIRLENRGILPAVWSVRDQFWAPLFAGLYRHVLLVQNNTGALKGLIAAAVGLVLLRNFLLIHAEACSEQTALDVATRLRQILHRQTLRLAPSDLRETESNYASRLFTADMERLREGIALWVGRLTRCPLEIAVLFLLAVSMDWLVTLQCLIPLAACWYLLQRERQRFAASRRAAAAQREDELQLLAEGLHKTRLVRGYGMEDFEQEQFQRHVERYRDRVAALKRRENWTRWVRWILISLAVGVVIYLLGIKVLLLESVFGRLAFPAALLLGGAIGWMHKPAADLYYLPGERAGADSAADHIYRYIDQIPEVGQAVGAKFLQPLSKSLQFEAVSYSLPTQRPLLDRLDLKLHAGETVAVVSLDVLEARAMAYLLPRFIEPQAGRVLFDGEDIAWVTLESLRAETIYVGGADPAFTGTVMENIGCGNPDYSPQHIVEAAKQTHAHNFIVKLPHGYETLLGEHGHPLEAGEAFRLGLARAILRKPALLIVEEPAAVLDDDTKSLLDDTYGRILPNRSVLFLPRRLSTLRRADRIIVLHRGRVEAIGTHTGLVKTSPLYRHWEYIHFNEFRDEVSLSR